MKKGPQTVETLMASEFFIRFPSFLTSRQQSAFTDFCWPYWSKTREIGHGKLGEYSQAFSADGALLYVCYEKC